jgi:hypothetical protein
MQARGLGQSLDDGHGGPPPQSEILSMLRLPAVAVRTERAAVAEFCRETGALPIEGLVPLTFPICWLTLPAIRPMIRQMIGVGFLPVHEAQSFAYERSLEIDSDYVFAVELRQGADPPRLFLQAAISTPQGEACGRLDAVLRLVAIATESAR